MRSSIEATSIREGLKALLDQEKARCGGYSPLQDAIQAANGNGGRVERRKLRQILAGEDISLSLTELQALDNFLAQRGKGLWQIFTRRSILEYLVQSGSVTFLLGSRPLGDLTVFSHWDVHAMADLLRGLERTRAGLPVELKDVPLLRPETLGDAGERQFAGTSWYRLLEDRPGPSVISLGTPRISHASEVMLARMLGIPAFDARVTELPPDALSRPPFFYVWAPDLARDLPSSFARRSDAFPELAPTGPNPQYGKGALLEGTHLRPVHWDEDRWEEFGTIVIQRRRTSQYWVCLAGLSGPSTLACADYLPSLAATLPEGKPGRHSPVLWAVVKAPVVRHKGGDGDTRELIQGDWDLVSGPHLWPPKA